MGGRQRSNTDDDDDPSHEDNMEAIMSRFNIVSNIMNKSNDEEEEDEKDEDEPENEDSQPDRPADMDDEVISTGSSYEFKRVEVSLPEDKPLE